MKLIQILGTGCSKCKTLAQNAQTAAEEAGIDYEMVEVTDINEITNFSVMMTPALAIDGEVKATGKILSVDQIKGLLA